MAMKKIKRRKLGLMGAIGVGAGIIGDMMKGVAEAEQEARTTADPAPVEQEDEAYAQRQAHREIAMEILDRKEAQLAKFNGKRQSMAELMEEMRADSDLSDCPDHFDWKWCDKTGDFIKAEPRRVENFNKVEPNK